LSPLPQYEEAPALLAKAELAEDCAVAVDVCAVQIGELAPPLSDQHQESSLRVVVVLMLSKVLCEGVDPFSQESDLHFGGAAIALAEGVLLDDLGLSFLGEHVPFAADGPVVSSFGLASV
jgi:hypothetical protein